MKEQTISVRTIHGVTTIRAWRRGEFAVHQRVGLGGPIEHEWSITHIPSGIGFAPQFSCIESATAAMTEIAALRDDWAMFDPKTVTDDFKTALRTIYNRHGGSSLPHPLGDRPHKLAFQEYATDLNGYRSKPDAGKA